MVIATGFQGGNLAWSVYTYDEESKGVVGTGKHSHVSWPMAVRFASGTRVEVFHDFDDCEQAPFKQSASKQHGQPVCGYWMFFAPGSGVFFNLGNTLVMNNSAICQTLLPSRQSACSHEEAINASRHYGIDSWQLLGTRPGNSAFRFVEIVNVNSDCHSNGTYSCAIDRGACPPRGQLTRGRT
ncbi:MAG: hypothetical protein SGPRY_009924, partial [Prymnesium sp.]